jgi:hypothetical protein
MRAFVGHQCGSHDESGVLLYEPDVGEPAVEVKGLDVPVGLARHRSLSSYAFV